MPLGHAPYYGESQAVTVGIVRIWIFEPNKRLEDPLAVRFGDTRSVVIDMDYTELVFRGQGHMNVLPAVACGVLQQIANGARQKARIDV